MTGKVQRTSPYDFYRKCDKDVSKRAPREATDSLMNVIKTKCSDLPEFTIKATGEVIKFGAKVAATPMLFLGFSTIDFIENWKTDWQDLKQRFGNSTAEAANGNAQTNLPNRERSNYTDTIMRRLWVDG